MIVRLLLCDHVSKRTKKWRKVWVASPFLYFSIQKKMATKDNGLDDYPVTYLGYLLGYLSICIDAIEFFLHACLVRCLGLVLPNIFQRAPSCPATPTRPSVILITGASAGKTSRAESILELVSLTPLRSPAQQVLAEMSRWRWLKRVTRSWPG